MILIQASLSGDNPCRGFPCRMHLSCCSRMGLASPPKGLRLMAVRWHTSSQSSRSLLVRSEWSQSAWERCKEGNKLGRQASRCRSITPEPKGAGSRPTSPRSVRVVEEHARTIISLPPQPLEKHSLHAWLSTSTIYTTICPCIIPMMDKIAGQCTKHRAMTTPGQRA